MVKLGKTSLPFFYTCQTAISGLWTSAMQPLGSVVRKKPTPKQTQTLHPRRWKRSTQTNTFFPSEIACLSSPWTSWDDATLSPHRIWWVPSGAGWSLRCFGQKMPLVVSPQPVFLWGLNSCSGVVHLGSLRQRSWAKYPLASPRVISKGWADLNPRGSWEVPVMGFFNVIQEPCGEGEAGNWLEARCGSITFWGALVVTAPSGCCPSKIKWTLSKILPGENKNAVKPCSYFPLFLH